MHPFVNIIGDFVKLFLPSKCLNCGINLSDFEQHVCKNCLNKIPKTTFKNLKNNAVSLTFWGRVDLEYATSTYFYTKGSTLQRLIQQIKYKGAKELAFELGKEIGYSLLNTDINNNIELIVPVPLHKIREKRRGYNQSLWLAKGIAEVLKKTCEPDVLKRAFYTSTQTRKSREQRWENVKDAFYVTKKELIINKHVLLVDDVLTTGATLEACVIKLLDFSNVKVSIATLAYASD